jgi:hypothetical protein
VSPPRFVHCSRNESRKPENEERDEKGTATDGYKHFLHGVLENGLLLEIVFKFVRALSYPGEELVVLITLLRRNL